jgi:hypothetical protein
MPIAPLRRFQEAQGSLSLGVLRMGTRPGEIPMPPGLMTVALAAAMQVGQPSPSEQPNFPPLQNAFSQGGFEGQYEQRYPFDTQQNCVHGYHQEIPAYGGYPVFRPYNYKDVLSQSQTAAGWGMSPTMPYSQQFWHRYHDQATMLKLSQQPPMQPMYGAPPVQPAGMWSPPMMQPAPAMATGPVSVDPAQQMPYYGQPSPGQPLPGQQFFGQPMYGQPYQPSPQPMPMRPAGSVYPAAPR